ncbi:MAG: bifunctional diaminohydroxyphosphoribosylaminopyrimidine deaminase/5-amino-6-(5-phosphoribosylamino)uracil reductase RibD [Polyangiales bacterium]
MTAGRLDDTHWMQRALRLAQSGLGRCWPNPAVGCVLVQGAGVVGEACTAAGGRPHAETVALTAAGPQAMGATAYVSLEPCAHHGQTPPCAEALVRAQVARVVIAQRDPDPRVDGRGTAQLKAAGIAVQEGVCSSEAAFLNRGFCTRVLHGRPCFETGTVLPLRCYDALLCSTPASLVGAEVARLGLWLPRPEVAGALAPAGGAGHAASLPAPTASTDTSQAACPGALAADGTKCRGLTADPATATQPAAERWEGIDNAHNPWCQGNDAEAWQRFAEALGAQGLTRVWVPPSDPAYTALMAHGLLSASILATLSGP